MKKAIELNLKLTGFIPESDINQFNKDKIHELLKKGYEINNIVPYFNEMKVSDIEFIIK